MEIILSTAIGILSASGIWLVLRPRSFQVIVGLCLLSAVVYAVSLVVQKPLVATMSSLHVTWLACTIGAVVTLPFAPMLAA